MLTSCSARGCRNRNEPGCGVTFHVFPKNPKLRQRWILVTGRKNLTPGQQVALCSDHFEEACFDRTGQNTRLRAGAIPTLGKFAPKNRNNNKQVFMKLKPQNESQKRPAAKLASTTPFSGKPGITTRSGQQLKGRPIPPMAVKTSEDKSPGNAVKPANPLPPPPPPASEPAMCVKGVREAAADTSPAAPSDVFICHTQSELDALLKKSKEKIEYLKKNLDYLSGPNKPMKQEPPDGPRSCPATLQKGAEQIKKLVKSAVSNGNGNSENQTECHEQDKESLQKPQKTSFQAQYIRYVVKIEPASKLGKKGTAAAQSGPKEGTEDEEEGTAKETETALVEEQLPTLHDSIMSHTASMAAGQNGLLDEKDKLIRDLRKQLVLARQKEKLKKEKHKERLMIAKQKEKMKMEQLQHLQEVIEMLKERCPEYSSQKDPAIQRHCSLCHAPLLKRCHRVAERWAALDVTEGQVSLPLSLLRPAERHPAPPQQLKSRAGRSQKLHLCPWLSNRSLLCPDCRLLGNRSKFKGRSSAVHCLRPHC